MPEWFIKLFTTENDTVLDPFMGSGTTVTVANRMHRNSIGIDIVADYCKMVRTSVEATSLLLLESKSIMAKLNLQKHAINYVEKNIGVFHEKRLQSIDGLVLGKVLKRKNPYLYKAKFTLTAHDIVKDLWTPISRPVRRGSLATGSKVWLFLSMASSSVGGNLAFPELILSSIETISDTL